MYAAGFAEGILHLTELAQFPDNDDAESVSEISTARYSVGDVIECRVLLPLTSKSGRKKLQYHITMRIDSDAAVAKHRRQQDRMERLSWRDATDGPLLLQAPSPKTESWGVVTHVSPEAVEVC